MGASGAGKTTLLNVLAQRINFGKVEGKILRRLIDLSGEQGLTTSSGDFLVDGRPLPKSFQRSSGYAEQASIFVAVLEKEIG